MQLVIICGSVFGAAEEVARHAQRRLQAQGLTVRFEMRASLESISAQNPDAILAITSTTGMGELPASIEPLFYSIRDTFPAWAGKPSAVLAMGDSNYGDTFCAAGVQFEELFAELGMRSLVPMLRLDASETVTPEADAEPWLDALAAALQAQA